MTTTPLNNEQITALLNKPKKSRGRLPSPRSAPTEPVCNHSWEFSKSIFNKSGEWPTKTCLICKVRILVPSEELTTVVEEDIGDWLI